VLHRLEILLDCSHGPTEVNRSWLVILLDFFLDKSQMNPKKNGYSCSENQFLCVKI